MIDVRIYRMTKKKKNKNNKCVGVNPAEILLAVRHINI